MHIGNDYRMSNAATVNKFTQSMANDVGGTFADIVNQKAAEAETKPVLEKSSVGFDSIGSQTPDEVKQAWMEAEEEIGGHFATCGLWITYEDGHVHGHITQIMVQRFLRWYNGEVDPSNLLGNSVGSAINVVQKCIYDIDHPLPGQPARSLKVQEGVKKERAFYELFLEKLQKLQ